MILSQTAEYALQAMSSMAMLEDGEPVRSKDISEAASIPSHYLSKVMRKLVEADLLIAIKLIHILEAVEAELPMKHCIFGWRLCNSKNPCALHHRWSSVNDTFQSWARQTTLADVKEDSKKGGWMSEPHVTKRED